jgi:hypothetical protein
VVGDGVAPTAEGALDGEVEGAADPQPAIAISIAMAIASRPRWRFTA